MTMLTPLILWRVLSYLVVVVVVAPLVVSLSASFCV